MNGITKSKYYQKALKLKREREMCGFRTTGEIVKFMEEWERTCDIFRRLKWAK